MMWFLIVLVLVLAAWFAFRGQRGRTDTPAAGTDALDHDRDGLNRPLPGRTAHSEGEVPDAARSHAGEHLEEGAATSSSGTLDADAAARAAHDSRNTGGTGAAVLAGIATAAGTAGATGSARPEPDSESDITNPPDPDTAGAGGTMSRGEEHVSNLPDDVVDGPGDVSATHDDETGEPELTNAPIGDTAPGAAARTPARPSPAGAGTATAPDPDTSPEERTNAPHPPAVDDTEAASPTTAERDAAGSSADGSEYRDRSTDARSNVAAGTATLAVGGATAATGATVLEDGSAPATHATDGNGDGAGAGHGATDATSVSLPDGGDARANVREMMKILNLRDSDAGRLDITKDDFARLWQGDASASSDLVNAVDSRLRRMLD